jgi:hypothetical protein
MSDAAMRRPDRRAIILVMANTVGIGPSAKTATRIIIVVTAVTNPAPARADQWTCRPNARRHVMTRYSKESSHGHL